MVDIPGNTTSTTTIRVGDTVTGSLETLSDQDWYRITLTAGQEIRISLNGFGTTPARDPYLEIRSSTGTVLSFNDDTGGGLNSMLTYRATTSGTYFINATSYAGSSTGTYQLSVASNQVPTSDIPDNATTSAVLSVGGAASGTLEFVGDRDWYRLNLTAGQQIKIDLTAAGASPLDDTYLRVYDANGNLLYENDDLSATSLNSSLAFQAPTSGAFYVSVGSFDDAEVGTYQVTVNPYQFPAEYSFQQMANQLVTGYWGGLSHRFNVGPGGTLTVNVSALTPSGQYLARAALAEWSEIMGVTFMEVFSGGQIVFDDDEDGAHADSVYSGGVITSSTVNVSTDWLTTNGTTLNSYSFQTYVHEIGHALGLGHAGNYNGDATFPYDALYANDSWASSVMSYFSQTENTLIANRGFSYNLISTPMIADILAISMLYGLSTTTRAGNTTYGPGEWSSSMGALTIFDSGGTDTIDLSGFGGNHRVDLTPGTFSNVLGEVGNVAIALGTTIENAVGGWGDDTLIGNNAANSLSGNGGSDRLQGGTGSDRLDGGDGVDTAVYSGLFRTYAEAMSGGAGTVSGGAESGTDTLSNVEFVQFQDGRLQFDADGFAAQVTRLYDTVLQRAPDQAGLDLWVDLLEAGRGSLKDVARGFLNSPEFQARTGSLSNADYVEFLYQNALGRASDPGGKAYWVGQLNAGADRADLLMGFSESVEHRGLTASLVAQGFFNTDDAYQAVALLYDSFAGRQPDPGGLITWAEAIRSGAQSLDQVADQFAASAEFRGLTAGMTNGQIVEFMYQNTLDRASDPGGLAYWTGRLNAGMDRGDLLIAFSQSQEHFFLLGPQITNGIDLFG